MSLYLLMAWAACVGGVFGFAIGFSAGRAVERDGVGEADELDDDLTKWGGTD